MKRFLVLALSLALAGLSFSQEGIQDNNSMEAMAGKPPRDPAGLEIFRRAYPDVFFNAIYQRELMDWKVELMFRVITAKPAARHMINRDLFPITIFAVSTMFSLTC